MQTASPDLSQSSQTIPQQPTQQVQTVPVPVTPMKRGGLLGVMDSVADALVGKTRPELGKDPDGNLYQKTHTLSRGEQWQKIAAEAVHGAAAGLAAGKGAGNGGKAALAGWEAGKQDQDEEGDQVQKQILANANNQMLRMKMAEEAWRQTRLKVDATQHDVEFSQGQEDRLAKSGATLLGTVAHPGDLTGVLTVNPDLMKDLVKNHALEFTPHYNGEGQPDGFKVFKTKQGYRDTLVPPGAEFPTFNPVSGQYDWHKTSDPETQGSLDDYWTKAGNDGMEFRSKQKEQELKEQQAAEAKAKAGEAPSEIRKNQAEAAAAGARATVTPSEIRKNTAEAEAAEAKAKETEALSGTGPAGASLVDAIGTGHIVADRLGYLLTKNPDLLAAVIKKYPDFDSSKAAGYANLYKEFTSTKNGTAGAALNQGATALKHLRRLEELNTPMSHVPHTSAWTAYRNQLDTAAPELAKFYGDTTIPAIAALKDTLGSTLPGNRSAAFTTQAISMSKKFDSYEQQWKNGAPSAAYRMPEPAIDEEARAARAHFDPAYAQRQAQEAANQLVAVQIPGQPVGHIPRANLQKFLQDNKGAQEITGNPQ
jgi:hypothetical protein